MKLPRILSPLVLGLTLMAVPLLANAGDSERPVRDAFRAAEPKARARAAEQLRAQYPKLASEVHSQLKQTYPQLEHGLAEAVVKTWEQHPTLLATVAEKVKAEHGDELRQARTDVRTVLEAKYPNFDSQRRANAIATGDREEREFAPVSGRRPPHSVAPAGRTAPGPSRIGGPERPGRRSGLPHQGSRSYLWSGAAKGRSRARWTTSAAARS